MARNERSPLLLTVRVAPARQRYPHNTLRRFCTIALSASLVAIFILFLLPLAFFPSDISPYLPWEFPYPHRDWPRSYALPYDELQDILMSTPNEEQVKEWSEYYTSGPHLAGKNFSQALWTKDRWQEFGITDTSIVSYDVYVNYPIGHRLALLEKKGEKKEEPTKDNWVVKFEAGLEENVHKEDGTSGLEDRIPTFHGYSASGNATAPFVYANYGTHQDFEDLLEADISVKGKIVLVKYGYIFRGLKVKRAQDLGAVGVVIYSDPGDDGDETEEKGVDTYPNGPAREPSSVQRGSVQFLSIAPGDPTTPGYPSKPGVPRQDTQHSIPSIPSIPISYLDALPLLRALNGYGPKASSIGKSWEGGGLGYKGVEYNIGPSPDGLLLNLVNEQEYVTTPMWNVIGIINGSLSDEVVLIGNHRDAWIAGGAADPNSGSATFIEVIRSFGKALEKGWRPLRTIVFASWDGEEYGLIGSTEWVEEFLPWLSGSAVAYLNVDVAVSGPHFKSAASPVLNRALYEITSLVASPNQTIAGQTVRDTWSGHIQTMGSGSDYTAFQDFAGIPCVDMGFSVGPESAVYHYHSNYDSFDWMDKFGDPGWRYHVTVAKLWSLLAAKLVESPLIQFNVTDYAVGLGRYLRSLENEASQSLEGIADENNGGELRDLFDTTFAHLKRSIKKLRKAAIELDTYATELEERLGEDIPWWEWWKKVKLFYEVKKVNNKYKYFERQFLYPQGLDGRSWFKHVVFAPGLWTGYSGATFPGLVESIGERNWTNAKRWSRIIDNRVKLATELFG
ncbi:hypothetical protein FGG08_002138 [Glutinoglossum americanum]|uniref:Uncharacterized protein n=1 Tax=Glutinoglossum americanum TaxID=1670608 RepID=A0A9P8IFR0_9PEZI|nr:hypothetical protein FGG08_002138 [Glutinoglossum americanum]